MAEKHGEKRGEWKTNRKAFKKMQINFDFSDDSEEENGRSTSSSQSLERALKSLQIGSHSNKNNCNNQKVSREASVIDSDMQRRISEISFISEDFGLPITESTRLSKCDSFSDLNHDSSEHVLGISKEGEKEVRIKEDSKPFHSSALIDKKCSGSNNLNKRRPHNQSSKREKENICMTKLKGYDQRTEESEVPANKFSSVVKCFSPPLTCDFSNFSNVSLGTSKIGEKLKLYEETGKLKAVNCDQHIKRRISNINPLMHGRLTLMNIALEDEEHLCKFSDEDESFSTDSYVEVQDVSVQADVSNNSNYEDHLILTKTAGILKEMHVDNSCSNDRSCKIVSCQDNKTKEFFDADNAGPGNCVVGLCSSAVRVDHECDGKKQSPMPCYSEVNTEMFSVPVDKTLESGLCSNECSQASYVEVRDASGQISMVSYCSSDSTGRSEDQECFRKDSASCDLDPMSENKNISPPCDTNGISNISKIDDVKLSKSRPLKVEIDKQLLKPCLSDIHGNTTSDFSNSCGCDGFKSKAIDEDEPEKSLYMTALDKVNKTYDFPGGIFVDMFGKGGNQILSCIQTPSSVFSCEVSEENVMTADQGLQRDILVAVSESDDECNDGGEDHEFNVIASSMIEEGGDNDVADVDFGCVSKKDFEFKGEGHWNCEKRGTAAAITDSIHEESEANQERSRMSYDEWQPTHPTDACKQEMLNRSEDSVKEQDHEQSSQSRRCEGSSDSLSAEEQDHEQSSQSRRCEGSRESLSAEEQDHEQSSQSRRCDGSSESLAEEQDHEQSSQSRRCEGSREYLSAEEQDHEQSSQSRRCEGSREYLSAEEQDHEQSSQSRRCDGSSESLAEEQDHEQSSQSRRCEGSSESLSAEEQDHEQSSQSRRCEGSRESLSAEEQDHEQSSQSRRCGGSSESLAEEHDHEQSSQSRRCDGSSESLSVEEQDHEQSSQSRRCKGSSESLSAEEQDHEQSSQSQGCEGSSESLSSGEQKHEPSPHSQKCDGSSEFLSDGEKDNDPNPQSQHNKGRGNKLFDAKDAAAVSSKENRKNRCSSSSDDEDDRFFNTFIKQVKSEVEAKHCPEKDIIPMEEFIVEYDDEDNEEFDDSTDTSGDEGLISNKGVIIPEGTTRPRTQVNFTYQSSCTESESESEQSSFTVEEPVRSNSNKNNVVPVFDTSSSEEEDDMTKSGRLYENAEASSQIYRRPTQSRNVGRRKIVLDEFPHVSDCNTSEATRTASTSEQSVGTSNHSDLFSDEDFKPTPLFKTPLKPIPFRTPFKTPLKTPRARKAWERPLYETPANFGGKGDITTPPMSKGASRCSMTAPRPCRKSSIGLDENAIFLKSLSAAHTECLRHPEAARYVKHFTTMKAELARKLFEIFNKDVFENKLPEDFEIEWSTRYRKTAGTFSYSGTHDSYKVKVTLSVKVCDSPERVRDTLAHELCHAAVKLINNVNESHGRYWKSWARRTNKLFPFMPLIARCHDYIINAKYTYQCISCKYRIGRHSKSIDTVKKVCGHCSGQFEVYLTRDLVNNQGDNTPPTPRTPRTPNKFALFVKECYSDVKKRDAAMRHKDVMKILGQEFAEKNKIRD